jgi:hypothetical protein
MDLQHGSALVHSGLGQAREAVCICYDLRIPTKPAIDSDANQPPVPIEASRGGGVV